MKPVARTARLSRVPLSAFILAPLLLLLGACATATLTFDRPSRPPLQPLADVSAPEQVSWNPASDQLAVAYRGLSLIRVADGARTPLAQQTPRLIAWAGEHLVAVQPRGDNAHLTRFDRQGTLKGDAETEGVVVALSGRIDGTIYALVSRTLQFRFGTNQRLFLLSWYPGDSPQLHQLADTTLDRFIRQQIPDFPYGPLLQLSPLGDELLYSRLHDPPAFKSRYRVLVRHIATGAERLVGELPLRGGAARLHPDGESVLFSDGVNPLRRLNVWGGGGETLMDRPATQLDVAGDRLYVDGALYRGGEPLWRLGVAPAAIFSPDGSKIALVSGGQLYVQTVAEPSVSGQVSKSRLRLRRLRAQGLIDAEEYLRYDGK